MPPAPSDLAVQISHWSGFYGLVTTAAATLVGLLFVAVSLHLDVLSHRDENEARIAAEQTLTNFSTLLVTGLVFNIPGVNAPSIGITLLLVGTGGTLRTFILLIQRFWKDWLRPGAVHPKVERAYIVFILRRIVYHFLGFAALFLAGAQLYQGDASGLSTLIGVVFFLLVGSLGNTWNLLIDLSKFSVQRKSGTPPAGSS